MRITNSVKLELLRHGKPHNQLLSPTTQYLGLCGCHEAGTIQIPYEHRNFITRLKALSYSDEYSSQVRKAFLSEMSDSMSNIFESVPGLMADLSVQQCNNDGLIHLRLIFSAAELSMLPFELINSPKGFPGEGNPLSLQFDSPLVMTREVRGARGHYIRWDDRRPKILFAAAAPTGVGTIPFRAHLHALRLAINPWLKPNEDKQNETARLKEFITVLPQASLDDIRRECSAGSYTHIHILAHGIPSQDKEKQQYGLALCGGPGQESPDIVDGDRLAMALRGHSADLQDGFSSPIVVTVASCDSGKQGSVIWPGSSLVHALHEAGIPFVVGSQFPLSKRGSIIMARELYKDLLWGLDPRVALHNLRQTLRSCEDMTHDWACVVAYASLPADLEGQLLHLKTLQARYAMITALSWAHYLTELRGDKFDHGPDFERAVAELKRAIAWTPASHSAADTEFLRQKDEMSEIIAMLGTAQKRKAQVLFQQSTQEKQKSVSASQGEEIQQAESRAKAFQARSVKAMQDALQFYKRAFTLKGNSHWAGVQYLSMAMCLDHFRGKPHSIDRNIWERVRLAAEDDVQHGSSDIIKAWAHGSMAELYFLAMNTDWPDRKNEKDVIEQIEKIIGLAGKKNKVVISTCWQFKRYTYWLKLGKRMEDAAGMVVQFLAKDRQSNE